jgi:hypothetical protein
MKGQNIYTLVNLKKEENNDKKTNHIYGVLGIFINVIDYWMRD